MALDPNLILRAGAVQVDPAAAMERGLTLRSLRNKARADDLEVVRRGRLTDLRKGAIKDGRFDPTAYQSSLENEGFVDEALASRKAYSDYDKQTADIAKTRTDTVAKDYETRAKQADQAYADLSAATDEPSYQQFLIKATLGGADVSKFPPTYNAAFIKAARDRVLGVKDQMVLDETARHNRNLEAGVQRGQDMQSGTARRGQDMADARYRAAAATAAGRTKAPTEFQGKSAGFASRAEKADDILNTLAYNPGLVAYKRGLEDVPLVGGILGAVANSNISPENQQAEQAQRDFVNAILRQESGAAIGASEFTNASKQYFPQAGDSPAVIRQKAQNRRTAVQALRTNAGPFAPGAVPSAELAVPVLDGSELDHLWGD